jgi:hypothetical protein
MNTVKDMIKDNKKVHFDFYRKGVLYYKTECGFQFRVPIEDCGDGVFLSEDRAIMFMRYINKEYKDMMKELEAKEKEKEESSK